MQTHTNMLIYITNSLATNKMPKPCTCQKLCVCVVCYCHLQNERLLLNAHGDKKCGIEEFAVCNSQWSYSRTI